MIVLGLTGKAGAGKDTVADYLVENHGFVKHSFAAPLKEMARKLDPFIGAHTRNIFEPSIGFSGWLSKLSPFTKGGDLQLVDTYPEGTRLSEALATMTELEIKAAYPEYRRLLQLLGTDCIRAIDDNFWVDAAERRLEEPPLNARVVFADTRFPNEAQMIFNREPSLRDAASVWEVSRANTPTVSAHASEDHVGEMGEGGVILNNGTLDELHQEIDRALAYEGWLI